MPSSKYLYLSGSLCVHFSQLTTLTLSLQVTKWFPSITALVIGPGLGRDQRMQEVAALVIERAVAENMPCVIDADALRVVMEMPSIVRGSAWTVSHI